MRLVCTIEKKNWFFVILGIVIAFATYSQFHFKTRKWGGWDESRPRLEIGSTHCSCVIMEEVTDYDGDL